MKTILLTGASGFIGEHLLSRLAKVPEYKDRIVLLSSSEINGYKTIIHKNYTYSLNDFLQACIKQIDIVIHCGSFTPKNNTQANNLPKCKSNIDSAFHLITQLPNIPKKFLYLSTVDVYQISDIPITENNSTTPSTLYGLSKLYSEKMLEEWTKKNNVIFQILRLGHIYGSGEEHYQKLIPLTIRKVLNGNPPVIFSKGEELRSFLHVSDCVNAIISALNLNKYYGPINIVSENAITVKQVVNQIINIVNPKLPVQIQGNDIPVKNFIFDNSKMRNLLIKESVSFEDGIREEIQNFRL